MTLLKMKRVKKEDSPSTSEEEETSRLSIESTNSNSNHTTATRTSSNNTNTNTTTTTNTNASTNMNVTDVDDVEFPVPGQIVSLTCTSRDLNNIQEDFDILKILSEGRFGRILLAKAQNGEKMVLKMMRSSSSSTSSFSSSSGGSNASQTLEDFSREMNLNYFLSPHINVVSSYQVSFIWGSSFVFVQEYAPYGDLSRYIHFQIKRHRRGQLHRNNSNNNNNNSNNSKNDSYQNPVGGSGVSESQVKLLASQLSSAVEFIHSLRLVHRDLRMENILLFSPNSLSRIKICDFGETRFEGSLVCKRATTTMNNNNNNTNTNTTKMDRVDWTEAPEICRVVNLERYYVHSSSDVWQVGLILFFVLTGRKPWSCADEMTDPVYRQYLDWHRRKSLRLPDKFKPFSPRLIRLFKRLLEPKPTKRSSIKEVSKYLKDDWLRKKAHLSYSSASNDNPLERRESSSTTTTTTTNGTGVGIGIGIGPTLSRQTSRQFENTTTTTNNNTLQRVSYKSKSSNMKTKSIKTDVNLNLNPSDLNPDEIDSVLNKKLLADRVVDWIARSSAASSTGSF